MSKLVFEGSLSIWETSHEGPGGFLVGEADLSEEVTDLSEEVIDRFPNEQHFASTTFEGRYRITIERLD